MAYFGITYAGLENALKQKYAPRLWKAVGNDSPLWKLINGKGLIPRFTPSGKQEFIFKHQIGRPASIEFGDIDQSAYPEPLESSYTERTLGLKYLYGSLGMYHVLNLLKQGKDASALKQGVSLLEEQMSDFQQKLTELMNLYSYGDGKGTIATVSAFSAGSPATITVDDTRHLEKGMKIDFIHSGSEVTNGTSIQITNVTSATTFTATVSGTPASGDLVTVQNSYNKAFNGLEALSATSGTFQGVNLDNYYEFRPTVISNDASGSSNQTFNPLRYKLFKNTIDKRDPKALRSGKYMLIANPGIIDAVAWIMLPDIRRNPVREKFELFPYKNKVVVDGETFLEDHDCTANTIYRVRFSDLAKGELGTPGWDDSGGGIFQRAIDPTTGRHRPGVEINWMGILNIGLAEPRSFGKFTEVFSLYDSGAGYSSYGGTT